MPRRTALIYIRVSRGRTHRKRLEIEDQRALCQAFAKRRGYRVAQEFVEVELDKGNDSLDLRPQLRRSIEAAEASRAPILVACIDRIARNVNFLDGLLQQGVTFIVVGDRSGSSACALGPHRAQSEATRALISERTRQALSRRRSEGLPLGNRTNLPAAAAKGHRAIEQNADRFARSVLPQILEARNGGASLRAVADEFNRRGVATARGGRWTSTAVKRVLDRTEHHTGD